MKPRLIKSMGIWYCGSCYFGMCRVGLGYTPALAYVDWLAA